PATAPPARDRAAPRGAPAAVVGAQHAAPLLVPHPTPASDQLHAPSDQVLGPDRRAAPRQELQIDPRISADASQHRLFRELNRLAWRYDLDLDARRHIGLVRAAHRVVVLAEDQLGAHAGIEGPGTSQLAVRF